MTTDPNMICPKCGKPFYCKSGQVTSAVPDICQGHEADPVAAFKERLRQKVEERINSLEIQQRNSQSTDGYLFYMNEINAQRGFFKLLDETH